MERPKTAQQPDWARCLGWSTGRFDMIAEYAQRLEAYATELEATIAKRDKEISDLKAPPKPKEDFVEAQTTEGQ